MAAAAAAVSEPPPPPPPCTIPTLFDPVTGSVTVSPCAEWSLDAVTATAIPAPGEPAPPGAPALVPVTVTVEEVQRLPIEPGGLVVQPDRGWVLVNIDTIVWTAGAAQVFDTVVLGLPVQVRVTPVEFVWDFGDGSAPLVTAEPGARYPNQTVAHTYTGAVDAVSVTLTTRWAGEFQVAGSGMWEPVAGLATTTETSAPFAVRTATASLTVG